MSRADPRLGALSRVFIDGVPLDLVADLLPFSSRLAPSLLVHVHLHARAQGRHGSRALDRQRRAPSPEAPCSASCSTWSPPWRG